MLITTLGLSAQQATDVQHYTNLSEKVVAQESTKTIDTSKVKFFVGEGDNISYLAVRWNDGKGADNLIWGYKWNEADAPTGETMLSDIAKADPRLYIMVSKNTFSTTVGGIGFDLDGNGDISVNNSNGQFKPSSGIITLKNTNFDGYTPTDTCDHWQSGWGSGNWKYYAADDIESEGEYYGTSGSSRTLVNGSFDYWTFESFEKEPVRVNYSFYLPANGEGISLPDDITLQLSDKGAILPVIIYSNGKSIGNLTWIITDESGNQENCSIKAISSEKDRLNAEVVFSNSMDKAVVTVKCRLGENSDEIISNKCVISLSAPEKPISGITFESSEIELKLNQTATNVIITSPEDATYTGVRYESSNNDIVTVDENGEIKSHETEGEVTITAISSCDETVKGSYKVKVVSDNSGIGSNGHDQSIYIYDNTLYINGYEDYNFTISNIGGQTLYRFSVNDNRYDTGLKLPEGIYILKGNCKNRNVAIKLINE